MSTLTATLQLYRKALEDAFQSIRRSYWAIAFLLGAFGVLFILMLTVGRAGIVGGFVIGFAYAGLTGWYLSLVEIAVQTRRTVKRTDIQETFGQYFSETISVMFLFFIPEFLLTQAMPESLWILVPAACLAFNPIPEMIYQGRTSGIEVIRDAAVFMQQNWPEWLGAHLLLGGGMAGLARVLHGSWDPGWILEAIQMFGPWFGFMQAGVWGFQLGGSAAVPSYLLFVLMFVLAHAFMIFRGQLYRRLHDTSRRGRAWQAQL